MTAPERTMRTLASVLRLMPANADMPQSVKVKLLASCGTITFTDLAAHDGGSLAELLVAAAPDVVDECDILAVSERILVAIGRMEYKPGGASTLAATPAEAPVSPAAPITVNLAQPKKREDMDLAELLDELDRCPDDAEEILDLIRNTRTIRSAVAKLDGGQEWAIANPDGSLNRAETVAYARHLAREHTHAQRKWVGSDGTEYWPTTIDRAIGRERRVMLYPFPTRDRNDAVLLDGPDMYGYHWDKLTDELHEAILWAVMTGHRNLRGVTDHRGMTEELFASTLSTRMAEIVEDYRRAKIDRSAPHHSEARNMSRYADDDILRSAGRTDLVGRTGSRLPFGGSPVRDESWYRQQLEDAAVSSISVSQSNVTRSRAILTDVRTGQGSITLNDCIVLGTVFAGQGNINGRFYMTRTQTAQTGQGSNRAEVYNWTNERLYNKAVELGLISA